jgi:hypothetical protein
MASRPPRFRPALLTFASLGALIGYVFLTEGAGSWIPGSWQSSFLVLGFLGVAVTAPVVYLARILARARLVSTGEDAFARLRQRAQALPQTTRALLAAPILLAFAVSFDDHFVSMFVLFQGLPPERSVFEGLCALLVLWVAPALGAGLLGRALLLGLLTPLTGEAAGEPAEGFTFSAVAVTPETRAAVGGLLAITVAVIALYAGLEGRFVYSSEGVLGLIAYVALAVGAAFVFQRASRIGIGFDGVLVRGSSRTRFFAYREIDTVEATRWGDVLLRSDGHLVLRLQLHGPDEGRHQAIADRIQVGILRARDLRGGGSARLAEAVGTAPLARAAQGVSSFRAPGVSREELWELVEAPGTRGDARAAAAEALALGAGFEDRSRMRIAAERCADPSTRAVLERVAAGREDEEEDDGAVVRRVRRLDLPRPPPR